MKVLRAIEALSDRLGRAVSWLLLVMVLLGSYNAIARYLGRWLGTNLGSNAYLEAQWYLFSLVFLLGGAYTLRRDDHVRVDVLYGRLSERARAWIDLLGSLLLLLPFCAFCVVVSLPAVRSSWAVWEGSPDPGGLPRYPIKTVIPVAFLLLGLQGAAGAARAARRLRGRGGDSTGESKGVRL